MVKLLDEIKDDLTITRIKLHSVTEDIEQTVFELNKMSLDELLDDTDELLKLLKQQRRDFNAKLKAFEESMKTYREFF